MFRGKGLRRLICFFMCALAAVQAARPGLQPSAAVTAQTWGRTCQDISGTASDKKLRLNGVKIWRDMFQQRCYCDLSSHPSKECGDVEEEVEDNSGGLAWRSFGLGAAGPGCRCLSGLDKARERSELVEAAAVRFCAAVVEETFETVRAGKVSAENWKMQNFVKKDLTVTPQLCQEILTGTLGHFNTSSRSKDVFGGANELSKHAGTKGWGHLDPLVTDPLPSPTDYEILLHHVCKDECEEIVNETLENIGKMAEDVGWKAKPFEQSCADRVVRQVEAEILGCCGRSCGWDGRSCGSWPFLNKNEKVDWLQQCCSEYNVLQNSSRERMCDSVLSTKQIRLVSQFDTKAKKGDVGGAYIGQDPRLLWAKPGLDKFQKQLKKMKQKPKENEPVSSDFLEKNPDVRKDGIQKGWFHEEKDPEELAASLAQLGPSTCEDTVQNMMRNHKHCSEETWSNVKEACFQKRKWQISDKPNPDDDDPDGPPKCQLKMIDPDVNTPQEVATPEECGKVDFGQVVKRRFFLYNNSNPPEGKLILENPILCFQEKDPCPDEDDFVRTNLNEFERSNGFGEYMYWTKEA